MVQKARIRLSSNNLSSLQKVCEDISSVVHRTGVKMKGPVPMPTRKLRVPVLKTPCGEGTNTWETYQLRIYKRLIDVYADERSMHLIMKINIPDDVLVEIELL
ncbi:MAG: 30S ribosomal protein S10 [Promethearchaeota archaeon]